MKPELDQRRDRTITDAAAASSAPPAAEIRHRVMRKATGTASGPPAADTTGAARSFADAINVGIGARPTLAVSDAGDAMETEADWAATAMMTGTRTAVSTASGLARKIHRVVDTAPTTAPTTATPPTPEHDDAIAMARDLRRVLETRVRNLEAARTEAESETHPDPARAHASARQLTIARSDISALTGVRNDAQGLATVRSLARLHDVDLATQTFSAASESRSLAASSGPLGADGATTAMSRTTGTETTTHSLDGNVAVDAQSRVFSADHDGVGMTDNRSRSETNADGTASSHAHAVATTVGLHDGGVQGTRERTDTLSETRVDGTQTEQRTTATNTASVGATQATLSHGTTARTTETDAGGTARATTAGTTTRGGAVYGPDGNGATAGRTFTRSGSTTVPRDSNDVRGPDTRVTEAHSASVGGDATLTDHGASGALTGTGSVDRGPAHVEARLGATGGFHIDLVPVADHPDQVDIVTRVSFGATGGTDARVGTGTSIGGGVDLTMSRSVTFSHRMTQAEAVRYLGSAHAVAAGGTPSAGLPDFELMARIRAAHDHGGVVPPMALPDARAAAAMAVDSSVETTTTLGVTGRVTGSVGTAGFGAGASGSAGGTGTRTMRVGRTTVDGRVVVEIHLDFSDARTRAASANVRAEGVAAEVGHTSGATNGRQVTVQLDPSARSYEADFALVAAAASQSDAEQLATRYHAAITRSSNTTQTDSVAAGLAGDNGVGTGLAASSTHAEGATVAFGAAGRGGVQHLDATTTGSSDQQGSLRVFGHDVVTTDDATAATNHVVNDGTQTVDVTRTQTDSVPVLPQFLQTRWHTTRRELDGIHFSDRDLDALVARAGDADAWLGALPGGLILHVRDAWNALGDTLRAPSPDPTWTAANPVLAARIARGQAITHFVSVAGSGDGLEALRDVAYGGGGRGRIGQAMEWPESISGRGPQYQALVERVDGATARYTAWTGADRATRIAADALEIRTQLAQIVTVIGQCTTFRDSSTRVSTLTAVQNLGYRIAAIERTALAPATTTTATAATATPTTTTAGAAPTAESTTESPTAAERSERALAQVRMFKAEELHHWQAAQSRIGAASGWFANPNDCYNDAVTQLDAIVATYADWQLALRDGAVAMQAAHVDPAPLQHARPNLEWTIQLLRQAVNIAGEGIRVAVNLDGKIALWRAALAAGAGAS